MLLSKYTLIALCPRVAGRGSFFTTTRDPAIGTEVIMPILYNEVKKMGAYMPKSSLDYKNCLILRGNLRGFVQRW